MLWEVREATSRGRLGLASIWRTRSCNDDGCSSCSGTGATEEAVPASQTRSVALSGVLRNCCSTDTDELIAKPWFIAGTSRLPRGSHAINRWPSHFLSSLPVSLAMVEELYPTVAGAFPRSPRPPCQCRVRRWPDAAPLATLQAGQAVRLDSLHDNANAWSGIEVEP